MSSNSLVFHTSVGISSSPAAFLFLLFLSTESSSCVNCPTLMSSWSLLIFAVGSCVTFGRFPNKFSKCCFHRCIRSTWLIAFNLAFAVIFLLIASFTVCHDILDWLFLTECLILLIWLCMYYICSFRYMSINSFCVFFSFWTLILVGFFCYLV